MRHTRRFFRAFLTSAWKFSKIIRKVGEWSKLRFTYISRTLWCGRSDWQWSLFLSAGRALCGDWCLNDSILSLTHYVPVLSSYRNQSIDLLESNQLIDLISNGLRKFICSILAPTFKTIFPKLLTVTGFRSVLRTMLNINDRPFCKYS